LKTNIRSRIIIAVVVCLVLISATLAYVLFEQSRIDKKFLLVDKIISHTGIVDQAQTVFVSLLAEQRASIRVKKEGSQFSNLIDELNALLETIEHKPILAEKEQFLLKRVRSDIARLSSLSSNLLVLAGSTETSGKNSLLSEFDALGQKITTQLDQIHIFLDHELEKAFHEASEMRYGAQKSVVISGTLLVFFLVFFSFQLVRSITRPINDLVKATQRLKSSEWDYRVNLDTGDELEELADSFNSMAEQLSHQHLSLKDQLDRHSIQLKERSLDLEILLLASAELSSELDIEQLLKLMAQKLTSTLKVTYCRIALKDSEHAGPVIRAAYPIRMLDWEPGIGNELDVKYCPDLQKAFDTGRYVSVSNTEMFDRRHKVELEQIFTSETHSGLIFPLVIKGRSEGAIILGESRVWDREPFSQEKIALCQTLINQSVIAIENAENYVSLHSMFLDTTSALSSAIDAKSHWTKGHSERMTALALRIGRKLSLDSESLNLLKVGCILHDIGKIGTYEQILNKAEPLTDSELEIIRQHPVKGELILKPIHKFKAILPIVRSHHEKYDGTGYPDGLKGEDIPILARIAALADTYDAMTADRPYRKGCSRLEAIAEIKRCSGTQFDPSIAGVFIEILKDEYS
jgi:putative nucleotidyltransferase with HDIG domain